MSDASVVHTVTRAYVGRMWMKQVPMHLPFINQSCAQLFEFLTGEVLIMHEVDKVKKTLRTFQRARREVVSKIFDKSLNSQLVPILHMCGSLQPFCVTEYEDGALFSGGQ